MKKKINVIQINGIKGLVVVALVGCCLAAGFIAFPGWVAMSLWNTMVSSLTSIPAIGIFQGILLWGIIVASYFTFRKQKLIVCMKSPQGLSEEELRAVFANIKKQSEEDPILQAMLKTRESELKLKKQDEQDITTENSSKIS